jgi:hypothetical protein
MAATQANQIQLREQHGYSLDSFQKVNLRELLARNGELGFFVNNKAVQLKDINSLDWKYPSMRFLICNMSPTGSVDKHVIGCRTVSYFRPFKAVVFNLTVPSPRHKYPDSFSWVCALGDVPNPATGTWEWA